MRRLCCAVLLTWQAGLAAAQDGASNYDQLDMLVQQAEKWLLQGKHQTAFELLFPSQSALFSHPDGAYIYGVLLLRLNKPEAAYTYLSTVVAMSPNNAGAKLDLALAAIQIGRYYEAQDLLEQLLALTDVPPGVLALVHSYQRQVQTKLQLKAKTKRQVELSRGYNSNVNFGLLNDQVTLDTINGPQVLRVDGANLAAADSYTDTVLSQQTVWANGIHQGPLSWPSRELTMQARLTEYADLPAYQQKTAYLGGGISLPQWHAGSRLFASLLWQDQQQQHGTLSVQWMQKFWLPQSNRVWQLNLGHSRKRSRDSDAGNLALNQLELITQGNLDATHWQLFLRTTQQRAKHSAAQNQEHDAMAMGLNFTLPRYDSITPQLHIEWNQVTDLHAYNTTLFGDKRKTTALLSAKFNLKYDLDNRTQLFSHLKWDQQGSNINLFATEQWQMGVGIRAAF